jgi:hypothetical protein
MPLLHEPSSPTIGHSTCSVEEHLDLSWYDTPEGKNKCLGCGE